MRARSFLPLESATEGWAQSVVTIGMESSLGAVVRCVLIHVSKSSFDTLHSLPNFTAGSSPERRTEVTTKVDTSMYSQMSATDSHGLSSSTRNSSMQPS